MLRDANTYIGIELSFSNFCNCTILLYCSIPCKIIKNTVKKIKRKNNNYGNDDKFNVVKLQ